MKDVRACVSTWFFFFSCTSSNHWIQLTITFQGWLQEHSLGRCLWGAPGWGLKQREMSRPLVLFKWIAPAWPPGELEAALARLSALVLLVFFLYSGWLGQSVPEDYEGAWPSPTPFGAPGPQRFPAEPLFSESVRPRKWPVTTLTTALQKNSFLSFPFSAENLVSQEPLQRRKTST